MAKIAVFCIADTVAQAESVVSQLQSDGFSNNDISVLFPDDRGTKDFAHEKHTKAPEGATTGASAGGVLGGALGWLVGIGTLAIPGLGPFVAAGPIMAALSGAAVGAAVGGVTGALVGMGIPEYEAKRYEGKIREGNILISVHCENNREKERVKEIFEGAKAHDISASHEVSLRTEGWRERERRSDIGDETARASARQEELTEEELSRRERQHIVTEDELRRRDAEMRAQERERRL